MLSPVVAVFVFSDQAKGEPTAQWPGDVGDLAALPARAEICVGTVVQGVERLLGDDVDQTARLETAVE